MTSVAANPGPAAHLAVLGVIVVIGLVVFAVHRWRSRHGGRTIDELGMSELSTDDSKTVKYALLGYDTAGSLDALRTEDKRALHQAHHALHDEIEGGAASSVRVIAHYRFRPARNATTVRLAGDEVVTVEGPSTETSKALRALYVLETDDAAAAVELAGRLPAVRMGGTLEVWPLIEPKPT